MKKGVILFHSNIKKIYKDRWVSQCVDSILNQTDSDFTIYEINYGEDTNSVIPLTSNVKKKFWAQKLPNYAFAMNFILNEAFNDGCDYVFNTNLDDYYNVNRIAYQVEELTQNKYDILSSDFCYIEEVKRDNTFIDTVTLYKNICSHGDILTNFKRKHNVIAHPAVCYSKNFWNDMDNRYDTSKIPEEDFDLWVRASNKGYKIGILDKVLLYYRIHTNQSGRRAN